MLDTHKNSSYIYINKKIRDMDTNPEKVEALISRYPNGYLPKIEYWQYKMNKAIESGDARGIAFASEKLVYFVGRQYGISKVKVV